MAEEVIKNAALGRLFQLGDLYNHRNDCIISGNGQDLAPFPNITKQLNLDVTSSSSASKWELLDLDEHLQASVVAGLIEKYRGASNFVNDVSDPSQATVTLRCHIQSKKESLDVKALNEKEVSFFLNNEEEMKKSEATHVVVGVVHGAEAYCVLTQDLDVNDENDREEAEEKLTKLSAKFQNALEDGQTSTDFADQFEKEEVKQLQRMKCTCYADNQTQVVRECGYFDEYKNCLKLIEQIQKSDAETNKAVPIAAVLCPLKVFTKPAGGLPSFEYYVYIAVPTLDRFTIYDSKAVLTKPDGIAVLTASRKIRSDRHPAEPGKASCRYSVYEDGNLLKENLSELPTPHTGLRIQLASGKSAKKSTPSIRLDWDYQDLGYPFHFVVESKPKNSWPILGRSRRRPRPAKPT